VPRLPLILGQGARGREHLFEALAIIKECNVR
jgi:hypothetical protein